MKGSSIILMANLKIFVCDIPKASFFYSY